MYVPLIRFTNAFDKSLFHDDLFVKYNRSGAIYMYIIVIWYAVDILCYYFPTGIIYWTNPRQSLYNKKTMARFCLYFFRGGGGGVVPELKCLKNLP